MRSAEIVFPVGEAKDILIFTFLRMLSEVACLAKSFNLEIKRQSLPCLSPDNYTNLAVLKKASLGLLLPLLVGSCSGAIL